MAKENGYTVKIKESDSDWWLKITNYLNDKNKYQAELEKAAEFLAKKNQHGVPLAVIQNMMRKWTPTSELQL